MLRVFLLAAIILINYVMQTTLWQEWAILGVTPDTALILIVSYAIMRGEIEGALFGAASGFVLDVLSGVHIGLYTGMGFVVGYVSGKPFRNFFKDNYFLPFIIVTVMAVLYQLVLYIVQFMFVVRIDFWFFMYAIVLPKTVYTAALAIPLYSVFHYANARLETYEKNRRTMFEDKADD